VSSGRRLLSLRDLVKERGRSYTFWRSVAFKGALPRVEVPDTRLWLFDERDVDRLIESWKTRGVSETSPVGYARTEKQQHPQRQRDELVM
jgi:hypothetical protein